MRKELRISAFEDIGEGTEGSVFMDNLTISSACRSVLGYEPHQFRDPVSGSHRRLFEVTDRERYSSGDYDYSLNDAFRLAVDLFSLAQLVEAIILFDRIFVDAEYIDRWGVIDRRQESRTAMLPPVLLPLADIVVPVELSYVRRAAFLAYATWQALLYAEADAFKDFMQLLSSSGVDGAFVQISDAYFQTGFSDQFVFPLEQFTYRKARESCEDARALIDEAVSLVNGQRKRAELQNVLLKLELFLTEADKSYLRADHDVLAKTSSSWGWGDKPGHLGRHHASGDIVRNVIAACFYSVMAYNCRMPYFPHHMRSPLATFDMVASKRGLIRTAKTIVESIERARRLRVDPINAFYGDDVIDVEIPALFSLVLRSVDSPGDILQTAFEIRHSREARAFRGWTRAIDQKIAQGVINIAELQKELAQIQERIQEWAGMISDDRTKETARLTVGLGPLRITWPLPWRTLPIRPFGKPHVLFGQRLSQVSSSTTRFSSLVEKVFGKEIADFYETYRATISMFDYLVSKQDNDQG